MANTDPKNGIPYGCISVQSLADWVLDEATPVFWYGCHVCGTAFNPDDDAPDACPHCREANPDPDGQEWYSDDPIAYTMRADDVPRPIELHWKPDSWAYVTSSPVTRRARPCSPCAPGAGNLDDLDPDNGMLCYGLPDDWLA